MAEPERLLEAIALSGSARAWLGRVLDGPEAPSSVGFRTAFAAAARKLGPGARERPSPRPDLFPLPPGGGQTGLDLARAALLLTSLARVAPDAQPREVLALFESGEIGEQESLLRILGLLPGPARFVETGLLGARANAGRVFEAIACHNAYPAAHFPERGFNQLVMKAIFMGVPVAGIEGLGARRGAELLRMLEDYASERRAAGRPVPEDVGHILEGRMP